MEHKISNLVKDITDVSGRNDKIDLLTATLAQWTDHEREIFDTFLNYVFRVDYSYGVTYDTSWVWNKEGYVVDGIDFSHLIALFEMLRNRTLSGDAALEEVGDFFVYAENEALHHLGKMIINRTLDCGIDKKTILKLFPSILPFTPSMMKCEPAEEKTLKKARYPAMLQLKIDAMRVNADIDKSDCVFWTFNGNEFRIESDDLRVELYSLYNRLRSKYGDHLFLDGELVIYSLGKPLPRKKSNGQANRILKKTAPIDVHENTHIVLWDVIPAYSVVDGKSVHTNLERFNDLKEIIEVLDLKYVHLVDHCTVESEDEAYEQVYKWIERGEEGGVLKNCDAVWEGKRSANCIKFKAERECELRVVGWTAGDPDSKYKDRIGSFRCSTDDGGIVVNVAGMSDSVRSEDPSDWIGRVVTVRFNEVIANDKHKDKLSLFLPRIIEMRVDKDETDSTETVKKAKGLKKKEQE